MASTDEQQSDKLQQRLWGAAVLIALAVIFLPLLLDGSGSESQFRRVERLREEPPRIIGGRESANTDPVDAQSAPATTEATGAEAAAREAPLPEVRAVDSPRQRLDVGSARLTAWVVQAGSFRDEQNALAVRDRLRRAGFPSFVSSSTDNAYFRVQVGPMIDKQRAAQIREQVVSLLGREALVVTYP